MAELPIVRLDGDEAAELADLYTIRNDLTFAHECVQRLLKMETQQPDPTITRALFDAAIISYARCFHTGVRQRLRREQLESHPGNPVVFHNYLFELRQRLMAHSVNAFEQTKVGAVLAQDSKKISEVVGLGNLTMRLVNFKNRDLQQFRNLIRLVLKDILYPRVKVLEKCLLKTAKALSASEISTKERLAITAPSPEDVSKSRKR